MNGLIIEIGPDPTRAYFWPAVNKKPTRLWPGYFLTQIEVIFLTLKEKIEKFDIFRVNFPTPYHRQLSRPDPSNKKLTRPRFDPSLAGNEGTFSNKDRISINLL